MPLYPNALDLIRANLDALAAGKKVRPVAIGTLTQKQLDALNKLQAAKGFHPMIAEVLFVGGHAYRSRVVRDGYTIDDLLDQIASAMDPAAEIIQNPTMTILHNRTGRADRYGNIVKDLAVLEGTARHPRVELFSVMPKGDFRKPTK